METKAMVATTPMEEAIVDTTPMVAMVDTNPMVAMADRGNTYGVNYSTYRGLWLIDAISR